MKIERENALGIYTDQAARADRPADSATASSKPGGSVGPGDGVTVSPEARVAQSALEAAAALPDTRQNVVDRMRALIDRGELGQDPVRLADSIIDSWLTKP